MSYRGFSGGGFVGNFLTTTLLEQLRPAADNAGRQATVGDPTTSAAPYRSDGISWKAVVLSLGLTTANTTAAATTNTAAIQAALTAGGTVQLLTPGVYLVNSVLTMPSNTALYLGEGVELKATGGASAILTNTAARASGTVIGTGNLTSNMSTVPTMTLTQAGIDLLHPAGSYVAIVGCATRGYNGVWEVLTAATGAITFQGLMKSGNTPGVADAALTANPVGMRVIAADVNIGVYGPGKLNGDGVNNTTYGNGDPKGNVTWFRNARWVTLDGLEFAGGRTWTIGSNNVTDYSVRNIRGDVVATGQTGGDLIHLSGTHSNVDIENIHVTAIDNVVGMTIDITTGTGVDFDYQSPGDMFGIRLRNVTGYTAAAVVGIYGPAAYVYRDLIIDGVYGTGTAGVQFSNYATTAMNNCTGKSVVISNITGAFSGNSVILSSVQNWDAITLDRIATQANSAAASFQHTSGTVRRVTINNLYYESNAKTSPMVEFTGAGAITQLDVSNYAGIGTMGPAIPFMSHTSTGTIGSVSFTNITATHSASGASGIFKSTGAGAIGAVLFNNCLWTGVTQSGHMCDLGATSAVTTVSFEQCRVETAGGLMTTANTTPTINVFMNNVTLGSLCTRAASFAGPTKLYLNGYQELTAPTNNPFQCVTAAKLYDFKMENVSRDLDSIQKTSGTLRLHGGGARTAIANVDAPQTGDLVYNITGTVRVARNIANSAWVNLHT
jgi:hypothetical protein